MPGLVRKILIFAAADGLVLQPLAQRGQRPAQPAKIAYTDNSIGPVLKDGDIADAAGKSFEAFGVIGKSQNSFEYWDLRHRNFLWFRCCSKDFDMLLTLFRQDY
jgi:hypothetical protein